MSATVLALLLAVAPATHALLRPEKPAPFDPTADYEVRHVEGWDVLVSRRLLRQGERELGEQTLRLLDDHLYRITRVVPAPALANLRRIAIWVELAEGHHPCMAYHPSADWLRGHGMNPQKARCVEIANARNFLAWTHAQPWMVLHELAHGYHDQVLGYDDPRIIAAYERYKKSGRGDSVLLYDGRHVRHYALTDHKEFFAEMTEAYFGENDFFPFNRAELHEAEPEIEKLMTEIWETPAKGRP